MIDALTATADQVLAQRWLLTEGGEELAKRWLKHWHPDVNPDPRAGDVFAKIKGELDGWRKGERPNTLSLTTRGKVEHFRYLAVIPFELGELYVGERHLIWATRREEDDLAKRWIDTVKNMNFPLDKAGELERYVPHWARNVLAIGDRTYVIIHRDPGFVRLADVLKKQPRLDPKHVAWICSRMYALCTGLAFAGVTHLDISPESIFINAETHDAALLGGWYYTGYKRFKPKAAPKRTAQFGKLERNSAHLGQIRLLGRRLLGANSLGALRARKDVPEPIKAWFGGSHGYEPVSEWGLWDQTLRLAYGPAKFVKWELDVSSIYQGEN